MLELSKNIVFVSFVSILVFIVSVIAFEISLHKNRSFISRFKITRRVMLNESTSVYLGTAVAVIFALIVFRLVNS